jgi:hypothetical protein
VFGDPDVGLVAIASRHHVATGEQMIPGEGVSVRDRPSLLADEARTNVSVIVGESAVGPERGEWAGQVTPAVWARTPIAVPLRTALSPPRAFDGGAALGAPTERA